MLERCHFAKLGFDNFTNGKVWKFYTDEMGSNLRENMDGWVEMRHKEERIAAWEYHRTISLSALFQKVVR